MLIDVEEKLLELTIDPTENKIRCSDDDCGGHNCKHIKFQIAQALATQREGYEQRIRELEKQNKIWVELVGNLHSKIFALESAGNKLAKLARTQVNWADSEEPISNWQKAKEEGVKP
jgi:hypothetical protein